MTLLHCGKTVATVLQTLGKKHTQNAPLSSSWRKVYFHTCHSKRKTVLFLAVWVGDNNYLTMLGELMWEVSFWDTKTLQISFSTSTFCVFTYFENLTFNHRKKIWENNISVMCEVLEYKWEGIYYFTGNKSQQF